jgi:hypothetical protein
MADETRYTVAPLANVLQRVLSLGEIAARLGEMEWFARAMRHIDQQHQTRPTTWGDPAFDYRHARLQVFQANHENFIIQYAVHMDRPVVFLRNIELLAGSPLFGMQ